MGFTNIPSIPASLWDEQRVSFEGMSCRITIFFICSVFPARMPCVIARTQWFLSLQSCNYCVCQAHGYHGQENYRVAKVNKVKKNQNNFPWTVRIAAYPLNLKWIHRYVSQMQQHESYAVHWYQQAQHLLYTTLKIRKWHKVKATPFYLNLVALHKQITAEMPCQPLKRVKNVRIRLSLIPNLDYFNPVAAPRLQITSIPAAAMKDNGTFCYHRPDSTAQ